MTNSRIIFATLSCLAIGVLLGSVLPPPALPKSVGDKTDWQLPTGAQVARYIPEDMAAVATDVRWLGDSTSQPSANNNWRLAGILNKRGSLALILPTGEKSEPKVIAVGQNLPDGSILQAIDGDQIVIKLGDCTSTYQPFQAAAVKTFGDCQTLDKTGTSPKENRQ